MLLAQSLGTTALQIFPIAAATTVLFTYLLSGVNARRTEFGKAEAAAEVELRKVVQAMRNEVEYAHAVLTARSTYEPRPFSGERLEMFAAKAVEQARNLRKRKQRKVRQALVVLIGEWRVRMAEDIGGAILAHSGQMDEASVAGVPHLSPADAQRGWYTTYAGNGGEIGEAVLFELSQAQLPADVYPKAIAALDQLLATVDATVGLNGRP
ncbi:hypothetical protein ACFWP3_38965 [Streptomyces sp. NPDC058525]|uniref:hypothetical protein n=1 Tax=Streptomyces sp. NPDC058525 TaxID=3346538 RepID=UPI003657F474